MGSRRRLPPLNAVRAFEAAARHTTFHEAGDELGVSAGAVAQQVKALEAWFGLALFRRLPSRGVALTPAGGRYAAAAGDVLDRLADATARLRRQGQDHVLTVSTTHSFASLWLIPRIGAFRERHRDLDVRIVANNALVDFAHDDSDVAIRHGKGLYPGLRSDLLMHDAVFPVCSPALRDGDPPLRRPQDLARHTLLHDDDPIDLDAIGWPEWLAAAGVEGVAARRGPRFTHTFMVLQCATAGEGVGLATRVLGGDLLAGTGLVRPFPDEVPSPYSFFVVTPTDVDPPKVARFRDWLVAQAAGTGP
ncbi:Glycine cleavage system transcriptional activator [Methylobacterium crusticola]|uniref:Glycine cleavage system transcriptional activator n=1 Tax=Methylobacterium crusticola TaxID=1697972 RepID=A0ABQ4QX38_9HYPH|nr:transcriptional regulator GcvA [Methylobacterium crusticola]GJD49300.1 Glycine cleavage system transcriptional activator [Methylobacterium crusticola]